MPEFTVKEVRLPELHLPEIKRDEIARSLSGIHVPDDVLSRIDRRKLAANFNLSGLPRRKRGLAQIDLGELVGAALAAVPLVRPASRSRWLPVRRSAGNMVAMIRPAPRRSRRRFALVAIAVAAVAGGWAILRDPRARMQLNRAAQTARARIDEMRASRRDVIALETGEPLVISTEATNLIVDDDAMIAQAEAASSTQRTTISAG